MGILPRFLDLNGTLLVTNSYDDPNRIISVTQPGTPATMTSGALPETRIAHRAVRRRGLRAGRAAAGDAQPRSAHPLAQEPAVGQPELLQGAHVQGTYPDPFYDLALTLAVATNPRPGWSMFLQVSGKPF